MEARRLIDLLASGEAPHAVAKRAGVPPKTLDTQMRSASGLKPEMVVKIARAYGSNPALALVEHGLLDAHEVTGVSVDDLTEKVRRDMEAKSLRDMSEGDLTDEVRRLLGEIDRRLAAGEGRQLPAAE